jgi:hypothetical protein
MKESRGAVVQVSNDGSLGSWYSVEASETLSFESMFQVEATCLANELNVSGMERE